VTDWTSHLGRTRRFLEPLGWMAAAALVILLAASGAVLAKWLDRQAGSGSADVVLLDLPPMPAAEAVSDDPGPQPEEAPAPDSPDAPEAGDGPPRPATSAEAAPEMTSPQALPDPSPVAEDAPVADSLPPVEKAEVPLPAPTPKAAKTPEKKPRKEPAKQKPAEKTKPAEQTQEASGKAAQASKAAKAAAASARGAGATASAMKKWLSTAQSKLGRHMTRKTYGGRGQATIVFTVAPSGQITAVRLAKSSGDAALDAALLAQARGAGALPPPPDGQTGQLALPVKIRG
jgi:protein TonB